MNAATKEGFIMNTLRRIPRVLAKAAAAGAVLVATAVPLAAMGTAGAATAPTLTCTALSPSCTSGFAIVGQGYTGTVDLVGTGFANDSGLGGTASIATNATGVSFSNVLETSATTATATITVSSATAPGFYTATLTDDNGTSAALAIGVGVVAGPQATTVTGNSGTAGGAATTVKVTGTDLGTVTSAGITGTGQPGISGFAHTSTTATFTVTNSSATAGTYPITLTDSSFTGGGIATFNYTVGAAAASSLTIASATELALVTSGSSNENFTITGTGFEAGAVVSLWLSGSAVAGPPISGTAATGISLTGATVTVTNATTITVTNAPVTATSAKQVDIGVTNPDTTTAVDPNGLGIGEAGATQGSSPTPPVAPSIVSLTYPGSATALSAGAITVVVATGSTTFPLTTGSTVTLTPVAGSPASDVVTGKVLSVTANAATIQLNVPAFGYTTVTTAVSAGAATTLAVGNATDIGATQTVTVVQGSTLTPITLTSKTGTTGINFASQVLPAIAAGTVIEYSYPQTGAFILSINNGVNVETTAVTVGAPAATAITDALGNASSGDSFSPGSYTLNAFVPGFNFGASAAIAFPSASGITGTVTAVNANRATIAFTVPKSTPTSGITLNAGVALGSASLTLAGSVAGTDLAAGSNLTIDAGLPNAETVTVASTYSTGTPLSIPLTTTLKFPHNSGAAVTGINTPTGIATISNAVLTNGSGWGINIGTIFATSVTPTSASVTASPSTVASGAVALAVTFTVPTTNGDTTGADWTVTTTVAGVKFKVGTPTGTTVPTTVTVAPGTPATASVPVVITNGVLNYTTTMSIVAGPTITAITAVGALAAGGTESIGVTGTLFNATYSSNTCSFTNGGVTDAAVVCTVLNSVTDSTTSLSIHVAVGAGALNGSDTLVINNGAGIATFASALTVSGQPTVTATSPSSVTVGLATPVTITGTVLGTTGTTTVTYAEYDSLGNPTAYAGTVPGVVTVTGATSVAFTFTSGGTVGDTLVFTVNNGTSTVASGSVNEVGAPVPGVFTPGTIAVSSVGVAYSIAGTGFLPGATVSIPAIDGTITTTSVTPNTVSGVVNVLSTATGTVVVTVTNASGGAGTTSFLTAAAPTITLVNGNAVGFGLSGQTTKLVITGTGFAAGAVVSTTTPGLVTFGTPVVTLSTNALNTCATNVCDTITVPVTYLTFTGTQPISTGLVVTNTSGYGTATSGAGALVIDQGPSVSGTYFVPTFSTNVQVVITGTGFEAGMTLASSNAAYTVSLVSVTPTSATLLVSTTSAATTGTSSTIKFTNPDGGSVSFALNGGVRTVVAAGPKVSSITGRPARIGKTVTFTIHGVRFGGVTVRSSNNHTTIHIVRHTATLLVLKVTVSKAQKSVGTAKLTIASASGKQVIAYSIKR